MFVGRSGMNMVVCGLTFLGSDACCCVVLAGDRGGPNKEVSSG